MIKMKRRSVLSCLLSLPVLGVATPAFAHREKLTSTQIQWNKAAQTFDITHIFHIHHTEQALKDMGVISDANLLELRNQARLAIYVEESFSLQIPNGDKLDLKTIGAEAAKGNVYVYQQCTIENPPSELWVDCEFLRPAVSEQINEVHLNINDRISSMRLSGRQSRKLLIAK